MFKAAKFAREKQLRLNFSARLRSLIASEPGSDRLASFSKKTGITMAKLSEWQNLERSEWPSMKNFLRLCVVTRKSADWFLSDRDTLEELKDLVAQEDLTSEQAAELVEMAKGIIAHYGKSADQQNERTKTSRARKSTGSTSNGTTREDSTGAPIHRASSQN